MVSKRGISPLIATVLIVGLTVAIAGIAFYFLKGQVDLNIKKGESQFNANEQAGVEFEITECKMDGNKLSIGIHNTGKLQIDCFWVAPEGGKTMPISFNIKPGKEDTLTLNKQVLGSTISKLNLYPCLISSGKVKTGKTAVSAQCS